VIDHNSLSGAGEKTVPCSGQNLVQGRSRSRQGLECANGRKGRDYGRRVQRMSEADVDVRPYMAGLDIQVLHIERVFFDELPAGFDVFAHQRGEDGLALSNVFKPH
jgi:hypothetical protein